MSAARMAYPGVRHGDITGHPHACDAVLADGTPTETVDLGEVAGRHITIETKGWPGLAYLSELQGAIQDAQARLSMMLGTPAGAA